MNQCPMCFHSLHRAFECPHCVCELDAIEAYDAGGPDVGLELPFGSRERLELEGMGRSLDDDEDDDDDLEHEPYEIRHGGYRPWLPRREEEGAFDTDYEELGSMQY